ncbi:MAG: NAD-dependent succinate-semialdehyde dehydrogenase [Candidatus Marinimicrobia bacterium]|nr:NAD-dependent succinate-semialdehyde dehydrogenase [Candidatus Neomarinimicrobiota bacterium]MCF7829746.1 NAD-dependent succinate-semialdehyde dehydrogenase [Candidatus Neomarinimicrobiota bacterium]MCF7881696.1 NAD-dependent succinate-semialdehyde dehydrogenase [Candidatus Neomarinimicrobiota bacterium]
MALRSVNPATENMISSYDEHSNAEIETTLKSATNAFEQWRELSFRGRAELMGRAAETLRTRNDEWAQLMTQEMGKPITEARAEVEKCAWVCDYYAGEAEKFLQTETVQTDAKKSMVRYEPLGPVLAVMPWNFPFWQVFRFAAPGLMAGNVGLLKHASNVPGCANAIEEIFRDAGFPDGVFQSLLIGSEKVGQIIRDDRVMAVTLTGSGIAGRNVAEIAGNSLKKTVLELGGSDPFLVLGDADIEKAVQVGVNARCINSGQSCIAAKRFIVVQERLGEFMQRYVEEMRTLKVGDPMNEETQIGPLAREDLRADLHDQVKQSMLDGADLLLGGDPVDGKGYFYQPTVLANVQKGMAVYEEETFGPVAAIIPAESEQDAIDIANDTKYGLGASLWTQDLDKAEALSRDIEAGCVFINEMVKSDPRLPFGGIKKSGYGRELSYHGIREFVNTKTIWIGE